MSAMSRLRTGSLRPIAGVEGARQCAAMRVLGLLLYALAVGAVAFGLFEVWYAKVWGFDPLHAWPLFALLALIVFALIRGGRSLRSR